ncbi:aminotransferase class I/II-fold pyridoxal phosphate-dependent enzyme [Pimelobacter simplex]|uniref:Aminotransferase class I/II-fold pyridoxal phosphate-dependent enzyme n=1 Tax=Nocardioides simplex TaxID=2045 RepID=A0A7J5E4V5_NOCSI|nr:aminotransferase class I/II-fold pyridoxal phosphate-dependent enzyme [Pimelobacter simplex]KAB2813279.1 aminotransferase class I/II-fold pyridoxal phosphate-dependent enzyme [Pimelobacter simplex]
MTVSTGPVPRPELTGLAAYSSVAPGPVPVRVRASSNEAPGGLAGPVLDAAVAAVGGASRYPLIGGGDLAAALASSLGVAADAVAVADGALPLLDRLLLAYVRPGDEVVMAWRSYEAYPLSVQVAGGRPVGVPLTADGAHDLPAMAAAVGPATRIVLVCNPNNPTGTVVPWDALVSFVDALPRDVLVVLDEAYTEYDERPRPDDAALAALADRGNVVVLRTFSKAHGLAGLRAGYLVASSAVAGAVRAVLPPFPVSSVAVAAALASLAHPDVLADRVAGTRVERSRVHALLAARGLPALPSSANFVWLPLADRAAGFADLCRAHGLLVRPFAGEGVRITVGDPHLRAVLGEVLDVWCRG